MHLTYRNVSQAFKELIQAIDLNHITTRTTQSRNGPVWVIDEPVTITYTHPLERTLLFPERDANPFFHVYEALWMLAGENSLAPLQYYVSSFGRFSDDGRTLNGAYGYRWRHAGTVYDGASEGVEGYCRDSCDQLSLLVEHLRADPSSRRAVLSMWNVEDDLLKIGRKALCHTCDGHWTADRAKELDENPDLPCPDCSGKSKPAEVGSRDVCCNLAVTFLIRDDGLSRPYLDMTVFNRSNDMVWGTFGANAVHFSFLQEYMANALRCFVGNYHQVSSNLHIYQNNWKPDIWLQGEIKRNRGEWPSNRYLPLFQSPEGREDFDREVKEFVRLNRNGEEITATQNWNSPFLAEIAQPLLHAFHLHKQRDYPSAYQWLARIQHADWVEAGYHWIRKRHLQWKEKQDEQRAAANRNYGGQPTS